MNYTEENYIKILYRFYSETLEEETVETMWVSIIDEEKGIYKLDNIPFYAKSLSCGDLIKAEYDEDEKAPVISDILEYFGHSTIQVVLLHTSTDIESIRNLVNSLGCTVKN